MVTVNLIIILVRTVIITATSAGCVLLFLKNGKGSRLPPCNSTYSMWFMGKVRGPVLKSYFIKYISNLWFIYCIISQIVTEEPLSAVNLGIIFTEIQIAMTEIIYVELDGHGHCPLGNQQCGNLTRWAKYNTFVQWMKLFNSATYICHRMHLKYHQRELNAIGVQSKHRQTGNGF